MKGIHLVAFLASWTVITASELPDLFEAQSECPAKDTSPPTLLSHESDCSKYYECKYGQKILRTCFVGLYFSKSWRGCVNKDISDCIQQADCPGPDYPSECQCKPDGTRVEHECQCDKFYECKGGQKALHECPAGEIFIPKESRCKPGIKKPNKDECEPNPCICTENDKKPHECCCRKFYQCCDNKWIERDCGKGWHFSNETNGCVCGECQPVCKENETKDHDCCCDKYFICKDQKWIQKDCEAGTQFIDGRCVKPTDDGCHCKCKTPGMKICTTKWRHECDPNLYWECKNCNKIIHQCGCNNCFSKAKLFSSSEPCTSCQARV